MVSRFQSLVHLSIWLLIGPASCGTISAWWNTRGPSIMMQDDDTGGIRYSLCNSNSTPVLPDDKTIVAPLDKYPPKDNTSLTTTGWMDGETAWASIFYLDNEDEIINSLLKCDWDTGLWENNGDYVVSGSSPKVAPNTGLAAVLLGASAGYRVYYNDLEGTLHSIGYTSDTEWAYYGVVSNDVVSSLAISSTFSTKDNNITIVRPRDDKNLGVARWYDDNMWHVSSFPQPLTLTGDQATNATVQDDLHLDSIITDLTLPSWDGNPSAIGVGIDDSYTRYVFYIGTDKKLYQLYNGDGSWKLSERPDDTAWPVADTAGGSLGYASDINTNVMRLYYVSDGKVIEAKGDNGSWKPAAALPSTNGTLATTTTAPGSSATSSPSAEADEGLSSGAKAGLSAGVTLGVIAIGGMLTAFCFLRRRQRKLDATAAADAANANSQYTSPSSAPAYPFSQTGTQVGTQAGAYTGSHPSSPQDGYPQTAYPAPAYAPTQNGYPLQSAYHPAGQAGYAQPGGGVFGQQQQQPGYVQTQDGGWTYVIPTPNNGQYQTYQNPQEMPEQTKPVEMMGEGHYKEAP